MKLLERTKSKVTKNENVENMPHWEITEVVLVNWNVPNNNYQKKSRFLSTFVPNTLFGRLLEFLPKSSISHWNWTQAHTHEHSTSCSHFNFRFRACFKQGVPWHSGNYRVWTHSEMRTCHDKNIQSRILYFQKHLTQNFHILKYVLRTKILKR